MPKIAKTTQKERVKFNAQINSKFDLLALEPEMGFYYLNLHSRCQKAHIYWCYSDEPGGIMRFNQTGIARKNPPHLNIALPPQVDALALRDLVTRLDTSLFLEADKYFCQKDEVGNNVLCGTEEVQQWICQLEQDIEDLPKAESVIDFRGRGEEDLREYLEYEEVTFPIDSSNDEVRELARLLGERSITEGNLYCWRLPWALMDLQKTLRGVDREQQKREAKTMAVIFPGYREVKVEDMVFHQNVAVNM